MHTQADMREASMVNADISGATTVSTNVCNAAAGGNNACTYTAFADKEGGNLVLAGGSGSGLADAGSVQLKTGSVTHMTASPSTLTMSPRGVDALVMSSTVTAATCTGTATEVEGVTPACDFDAGTDGTADCPAGCDSTVAGTPTIDVQVVQPPPRAVQEFVGAF